ncbi:class I SAM-dependent RNA methyltransferase [Cyanobium sp. WAJ14-Wanaka]|uniref:THUMP domain-containing class I SAM-dependent RNA methyltransferase n=1 Tax=Cyanobium sp. WAJ14-Wanaka TaxID=2823725 RepID=UPI0020CDCEC8|nr:THUMP domain-containing protein [Cyanobium sp. WAJ14-Wanaka]MCP9776112.1 class I SAM-dependent RNA methyltransferase [Cyanobium sp. WAJ14-Wanaka]
MTEPITGIAVVPPGLEAPAAAELTALGCCAVAPLRRAVRFQSDLAGFYRLHLQARLPFRLLRELAQFPCYGRNELYDGVQSSVDWAQWLPPGLSFRVDASGTGPGLNHSHYSALQVKNALVDLQRQQWGQRSSVDLDNPDLAIHLHLGQGRDGGNERGSMATLSIDGSGGSLHRRGYRAAMGLAPLKENLAAGLIALTGWDGRVPLADPLCGSGTLLIEAACMALGRAPGLGRHFGFERWPDFDLKLWQQERESAQALRRDRPQNDGGSPTAEPLAPLVGMEHDPAVLAQAKTNAEAAGVSPWLDLRLGDCRDFAPPARPGILVCNPPYGERIGEREALWPLYSDLGQMLKERCGGWSMWLLSGNPELTGALKMKASRRIPVSNGGIDCRWLHYEIR